MKRFTPLVILLLMASVTLSAQSVNYYKKGDLKGSGEIFYSETFDWGNPDDPKGWTAPEGFYMEDHTEEDLGFNFTW